MIQKRLGHSKFAKTMLILGVALGVILLDPNPLTRVLREVFHTVLWPIEKIFSKGSYAFSGVREFVSSIGELKQTNERLIIANLNVEAEVAQLRFFRTENDQIRKEVGLSLRETYDTVSSEVIASPGVTESGFVVIDRGSLSGISSGMPVLVGDGVIIGVIDEVYPASSRVMLLTHSKMALSGLTSDTGIKGVVKGERGVGMILDMVSTEGALHVGDRVVTAGSKDVMPSGLLVGTIENIRESSDKLFSQATLVSPVDMSAVRFVSVIRVKK